MDNSFNLLIIILLLAGNAFFVAAEFALVKAKGVRIDDLAFNGNGSAKVAKKIQLKLEAYLAACQLGITMASLGLGWVGEPFVAGLLEPVFHSFGWSEDLIHTVSFIVGFMVFSSLHIVVGEQVPKTYAIRKPERVALWIAYPLHAFFIITYPFNRSLGMSTTRLLRMFGVQEVTHAEVYSGDEIHTLISTSELHGELERDRADMLKALLSIDKRIVRDVMVPRVGVDILDLTKDAEYNMKYIRETKHSRFPVIDENDEVIGVLLLKDLMDDFIEQTILDETLIRDRMRDVFHAPELMMASELFDEMRKSHQHMTIVVDEYGDFEGLITMEDLLEEIVGEIADEHDEQESEYPIEQVEHGVWLAHGLVSLSQVETVTGFTPDREVTASTLSGLFMQRTSSLPIMGGVLEENGYRMTVEEVKKKRAEQVRIEMITEDVI